MPLIRGARSMPRLIGLAVLIAMVIIGLSGGHKHPHVQALSSKVASNLPALPHVVHKVGHSLGIVKARKGKGHILVTGGGGVLGQPLVKRLLDHGYDVTLQDIRKISYMGLTEDVAPGSGSGSGSASKSGADGKEIPRGVLDIQIGDITQRNHVRTVLTTPRTKYTGVVHLAGVSRRQWCEERKEQCRRVNVDGIRNVVESLDGQPWLLYISSMDVHGTVSSHFGEGTTALGETQKEAETQVQRYKGQAMIIRPSTIYGSADDIQDRLIPSYIKNALTGLPIQVMNGEDRFDYLHLDDAIDGIIKGVERLDTGDILTDRQDSPNSDGENGLVSRAFEKDVETYDLISGFTATTSEVLSMVVGLTDSASPIQDFTGRAASHTGGLAFVPPSESLIEKLGFQATINLNEGIIRYIRETQQRFLDWSHSFLRANCPSSKYGDPKHVTASDLRNRHPERLDQCVINIGANHQGWMHYIKCGEIDGISCQADNIKRSSYNWNQTVFIIHRTDNEKGKKGKKVSAGRKSTSYSDFTVQFVEEQTGNLLGFRMPKARPGLPKTVKLKLYDPKSVAAMTDIHTHFQPLISHNSSAMHLFVPETGERLHITPVSDDNDIDLVPADAEGSYQFRMTLLCCPTSEPWPLLLDDFENADIRYGNTGDIPFNASQRNAECRMVESALERMQRRMTGLQVEPEIDSSLIQMPFSLQTTHKPHSWRDVDIPTICMNDGNNPLTCVKTDDCRCIAPDQYPLARDSPLLPKLEKRNNKIIKIDTPDDFARDIAKRSWRDVLLPAAARILDGFPDLPKVHVISGYEGEEEIEAAECHKLQSDHCFSADSIGYRAMRHLQVPPEEAEIIVLPVYQHCDGAPFILHQVIEHANKVVPDLMNRTVAAYLTHDWGTCIEFAWNIWDARENGRLYPDWIIDNFIIWSPMGDAISKCYRPHQDVVVPPRTCRSNDLRKAFGDLHDVVPMSQRKALVTWSGTQWGTGKSARLRLTCERGGEGEKELVRGAGPQSKWFVWDYMEQLSIARFCPQPTGIAGWSFRIQDAIYAGCIPVLMSEGTHFPFADILDWSKFSIRVSPTELDHLESILGAIPLERLEEMQANLMSVREAFLYSTDESPEDELNRRGPVFFALQSARIRGATRYPK